MTSCKDCDEFFLTAGGQPVLLPDGVSDHLQKCPRCAEIHQRLRLPEDKQIMDTATIPHLKRIVRTSLKPVKSAPSGGVFFARLLTLCVSVLLGYWLIAGMQGWPMLTLVQRAAMSVYAVAAFALVCTSLYWSMLPGSLRRFSPWLAAGVIGGGFALFTLGFTPFRADPHFVAHGWPCAVAGVAVFLVTTFSTAGLLRRGFSLNSGVTGLLLGGLGALTSLVALQFACPNQEASHLLAWHGSIALVGMLLGYRAGTSIVRRLQAA